ncbi:Gfo/Idh/MocA family protein [Singulisphaera sp. PoT]|uniref:Gfo/Idh/MocA family protein n=1 Tax=Singulisphaera sp. PoT TaxID=3411797 RepID=UPI003BF4E191
MHSSKLRGGLIGCGFVSQHHIAAWKSVPDATLVALCDLDPIRLQKAAEQAPEARLYADAGAMFRAEMLDFVEICTRPDSHPALVDLAAAHKAHVLCQKPAAIDRESLLAMIAASDVAGIRLMIHENWRFRPWYRAMLAQIATGLIGRPLRLRLAHRDTLALRADGFSDQPYFAQMPRLILFEMGCHLIDTARFLLGEVVAVTATTRRFGSDHIGEDMATLDLDFASGAVGLLDMNWCAPAETARPEWALNETVVEGTLGSLRVLADGSLEWHGLQGERSSAPVDLPPADQVYLSAYAATQHHFISGLIAGTPHETSALDTLKTMDIVWAAYESADERRTIVVPIFPGSSHG